MTQPNQYTYDLACEILAEHFLGTDAPRADVEELAQRVQDAVEEWFLYREIKSKDAP